MPTGLRICHYVIHEDFLWKAVMALHQTPLLQSPAPCNLPTAERAVSLPCKSEVVSLLQILQDCETLSSYQGLQGFTQACLPLRFTPLSPGLPFIHPVPAKCLFLQF